MKNFNKKFQIEVEKLSKAKDVDMSNFDMFMASRKMKSFTRNPEAAAALLITRKVFPRLDLEEQKSVVKAIRTSDYKKKSEILYYFSEKNNLVVDFIIK